MDRKEKKQNISVHSIASVINKLLRDNREESGQNNQEQMLSYNGRMVVSWEENPGYRYPREADIPNGITETGYPNISITDRERVKVILRSGTRHYVFLKSEAHLRDYLKHVCNAASMSFEFYVIHNDKPYLVSVEPRKK